MRGSAVVDGQARDPGPYPEDHVVGVIDRSENVRAAVEALDAAGYNSDDVTVLCGQSGLERLDADGSHHGLLGRVVRLVQTYGTEGEALRLLEDELQRGHFVIGVRVPDDAGKQQVADLLAEHGGSYLHHYDRWHLEQLIS